jgi:hypothetical protein
VTVVGGRAKISACALALAIAAGAAPAFAFETSSAKNFSTPTDVPGYFAGDGAQPTGGSPPPASPAPVARGAEVALPPAPAVRPPTSKATASAPVEHSRGRTAAIQRHTHIASGKQHLIRADATARGHGGKADPSWLHRASNGIKGDVFLHGRPPARAAGRPGGVRAKTAKRAQRHA